MCWGRASMRVLCHVRHPIRGWARSGENTAPRSSAGTEVDRRSITRGKIFLTGLRGSLCLSVLKCPLVAAISLLASAIFPCSYCWEIEPAAGLPWPKLGCDIAFAVACVAGTYRPRSLRGMAYKLSVGGAKCNLVSLHVHSRGNVTTSRQLYTRPLA